MWCYLHKLLNVARKHLVRHGKQLLLRVHLTMTLSCPNSGDDGADDNADRGVPQCPDSSSPPPPPSPSWQQGTQHTVCGHSHQQ
jgi:hypothetical protein